MIATVLVWTLTLTTVGYGGISTQTDIATWDDRSEEHTSELQSH